MSSHENRPDYPLTPRTIKILSQLGVTVSFDERPNQSTKRKIRKMVTKTHDFLEYLPFVAKYVTSHYKINRTDLDYACYLFPKVVFTLSDLLEVPTPHNVTMGLLVRKGIVQVYAGEHLRSKVYELTPKAKKAVKAYNKYLLNFDQMPILGNQSKKVGGLDSEYARKIDSLVKKLKQG